MRRALVALTSLVVLLVPGAARADVAPPGQVKSAYETSASGNSVNRDCGLSKKLPGSSTQSLWLFCDSVWSGTSSGFMLGSTAAVGPFTAGKVPTGISEVPTPPGAIGTLPNSRPPARFLPAVSGLTLPDGKDCHVPGSSYAASWLSGVAQQPSTADPTKLLITYSDVCVHPAGITTERFGLVEYKPSTNALSGQTSVYTQLSGLPFQKILGSPIFSGGYLYMFGYVCDENVWGACLAGRVTLTRVTATPASWRVASNYRYWTGSAWSTNAEAATSLIPGITPYAVHVEDFSALGKGFVMIEQPDISGKFRVWRSTSLTSGWTNTSTGNAPCGAQAGLNLCRAYYGHPELSTSTNLLMSYYDPTTDHVSVMATPW
jgi:hypothetical protein